MATPANPFTQRTGATSSNPFAPTQATDPSLVTQNQSFGPSPTSLGMGPFVRDGQAAPQPTVAGTAGNAATAIQFAMSKLGQRYTWGGSSDQTGWDCSGLVQAAFKAAGIALPRTTWDQMKAGAAVASLAGAKPGDLLFFDGGGHVGIYLGNGQMIDAPHTGANVRQEGVWGTPDAIRRLS